MKEAASWGYIDDGGGGAAALTASGKRNNTVAAHVVAATHDGTIARASQLPLVQKTGQDVHVG